MPALLARFARALWSCTRSGSLVGSSPADAAKMVRKGGVALGVVGVLLLVLRGSFGLAGALAERPVAGWRPRGRAIRSPARSGRRVSGRKARRVSTARSATIEMRLDLDTGAMSGVGVRRPLQGRALASLDRPECLGSTLCERDDPEGAALLETYLDRRFPSWREADEGQTQPRRAAAALAR